MPIHTEDDTEDRRQRHQLAARMIRLGALTQTIIEFTGLSRDDVEQARRQMKLSAEGDQSEARRMSPDRSH